MTAKAARSYRATTESQSHAADAARRVAALGGRPDEVAATADLSDAEALVLLGWSDTLLAAELAQARAEWDWHTAPTDAAADQVAADALTAEAYMVVQLSSSKAMAAVAGRPDLAAEVLRLELARGPAARKGLTADLQAMVR